MDSVKILKESLYLNSKKRLSIYLLHRQHIEGEIQKFYSTLDKAKAQCKSQETIIIIIELNAKIGKERIGEIVDNFGRGTRKEHGEKRVQ